jgi:hypothetical protein
MSNELIGTFESHSAYEQQKRWTTIFYQVIAAYYDVLCTSPLVACNYDDEVRPRRLGPGLQHFKIDVDNATAKALENNPVLLEQWEQLVNEEPVPPNTAESIARKCGRIYQARHLSPAIYFAHVRKGRPDRRSKLPTEVAA